MPLSPSVCRCSPSLSRRHKPADILQAPRLVRARRRRAGSTSSPSSMTTAATSGTRNGVGIRRRGVAADDDRDVRDDHARTRLASASTSSVSSACIAAIPTRPGRARRRCVSSEREAQIGERDLVPARFERRRDVLHPERLDSEERTQAETFVRGHRTKEKDSHLCRVGG